MKQKSTPKSSSNPLDTQAQNPSSKNSKQPLRKIEVFAAIVITLATIVVLNLCSPQAQPKHSDNQAEKATKLELPKETKIPSL